MLFRSGLAILRKVKERSGLPILTDVHYPEQVAAAAEVADVLQIPAYLCMQSHLVVTAARTGRVVNLKHGQFLAPENMAKPVKKMKDKAFARAVDRGEIRRGAEAVGMPLLELVALTIAAQVPIADALGVGGSPAPDLPDQPVPAAPGPG